MRILWITNQAIPEIAGELKIQAGLSGGWMTETAKQLTATHELGIAFPVNASMPYTEGEAGGVRYYAIPCRQFAVREDTAVTKRFERAIRSFRPDIVHIWGTEYIHSYLSMLVCENLGLLHRTVLSIQGLISVCARHFYAYIEGNGIKIPTLLDVHTRNGLERCRSNCYQRGMFERKAIGKARHVIGRTDFDKACVSQINPDARYHCCNETLRASFYRSRWNIAECERHSLFVSQSHYPLKGLHLALEALAILKTRWPDARLYATGRDRLRSGIKERILDSGYDRYIRKLIRKHGLEKHVVFLGRLNEQKMCERFLRSHVFVSASSIENSPNSVGEAMLLGVPVVSSDVGGVKSMLEHGSEGFVYPADAPYMLAYYVSRIFEDDGLAVSLSGRARQRAGVTHDRETNLARLTDIYRGMAEGQTGREECGKCAD